MRARVVLPEAGAPVSNTILFMSELPGGELAGVLATGGLEADVHRRDRVRVTAAGHEGDAGVNARLIDIGKVRFLSWAELG